MELTKEDTFKMLNELLFSAVHKFEFPRISLQYKQTERFSFSHNGDFIKEYVFVHQLTYEEINILATYMIVEWLGQQLASVENTRMKYSGSDFKFTSQANHMQKLLQLKKDYEREGFHLQRLYKRRIPDKRGVMRSTLGVIMQPVNYSAGSLEEDSYRDRNVISYEDLIDKPQIESHELIGNKKFSELSLTSIDPDQLNRIFSS